MPTFMGEVAAFARVLTQQCTLTAISEQVRFARARFGQYDLIDFVVVLLGYTLSGEATLKAFYERLAPWASPFMALFGRSQLPHRSPAPAGAGRNDAGGQGWQASAAQEAPGASGTRRLSATHQLLEQCAPQGTRKAGHARGAAGAGACAGSGLGAVAAAD